MEDAHLLIKREERLRDVPVAVDSAAHSCFVIVVALIQFAAALRAELLVTRRINLQVDDGAALRTDPARSDPLDENLEVEDQRNDSVEFEAERTEDSLELLGLRARARVAVKEDAPAFGLILTKFFFTISPTCTSGTSRPCFI